jgi:hypothetical protein
VKLIYCRFHQEIMESIYDCPCIIFRKWQNLHRQKERNWVIQNAWNQALCSKTRKLSALRNSPKHHYRHIAWTLVSNWPWYDQKDSTLSTPSGWYWFLTPIPQQHFCFLEKLVPTAYSKLSPLESSRSSVCMEEHLRWVIPMLQGAANGINWRSSGRRVGFDWPWHPSSRLGSVEISRPYLASSTEVATAHVQRCNIEATWKTGENNQIMLSRSSGLGFGGVQRVYGIACLKGCFHRRDRRSWCRWCHGPWWSTRVKVRSSDQNT